MSRVLGRSDLGPLYDRASLLTNISRNNHVSARLGIALRVIAHNHNPAFQFLPTESTLYYKNGRFYTDWREMFKAYCTCLPQKAKFDDDTGLELP